MPDSQATTLVHTNAERFKALGHPIRLAILRMVVQGPEAGTPAGEIQAQVGIPASTLSHHLACLSETGLVAVERDGSFLRYRADFPTLRTLTEYLWQDCCAGATRPAAPAPQPKACCGAPGQAQPKP